MSTPTLRVLAAALAAFIVLADHALAWGPEGHRIAAEIAEQYLEPAAGRQVRELLALENATTLAEVSGWADDIRARRPDTLRWHFVEIPIYPPAGTPTAYDAARDCPESDCVVAAIERFAAVLHDRMAPARDRLEALKFLVHLVADLHQPLNCADGGDDHGNDTRLIFLGQQTNLRALWDSGLLVAAGVGDERGYALKLDQSIKRENLARWRSGSVAEWTTESYRIARMIYGGSHEARALQIFYAEDFLPVVNVQLEKAGLRLAAILNTALP
jgi:hypothetical protein